MITGTPGLSAALEQFPLFRSLATLGGNPQLVQVSALVSLIVLVGLATATLGFRQMTPTHRALLAAAGMLTIVAGAGWLLLLLFSPLVLLLILATKLL